MLFGPEDVGKRKVDAAAACLKRYHVPDPKITTVKAVHIDAVEHWGDIVRFAKESTVIFNNIDVGAQFDYAVMALGEALHIPVLSGSSFAYIWMTEFFTGLPGATSLSYCPADKVGKTPEGDKLTPELIMTYDKLDCITPDNNPPTRSIGSNTFVAMTAGMTIVQMWTMFLLGHPMPNFVKGDIIRQYDENLLVCPQMEPVTSTSEEPKPKTSSEEPKPNTSSEESKPKTSSEEPKPKTSKNPEPKVSNSEQPESKKKRNI